MDIFIVDMFVFIYGLIIYIVFNYLFFYYIIFFFLNSKIIVNLILNIVKLMLLCVLYI